MDELLSHIIKNWQELGSVAFALLFFYLFTIERKDNKELSNKLVDQANDHAKHLYSITRTFDKILVSKGIIDSDTFLQSEDGL